MSGMALIGVISSPLAAQEAMTGSRLPGQPVAGLSSSGELPGKVLDRNSDEAVKTARAVADCVLAQSPKNAVAVVEAVTEETRKTAVGRIYPALSLCLGEMTSGQRSMFEFSPTSLTAVLAEALLRKNKPAAPAPLPMRKDFGAAWESADPSQHVVDEMANCIAATHPDLASALVLSEPGSPNETHAFAAIMPTLGPCLVTKATLKTNRTGIRMSLATALYHRDFDPSPDAVPSKTTETN